MKWSTRTLSVKQTIAYVGGTTRVSSFIWTMTSMFPSRYMYTVQLFSVLFELCLANLTRGKFNNFKLYLRAESLCYLKDITVLRFSLVIWFSTRMLLIIQSHSGRLYIRKTKKYLDQSIIWILNYFDFWNFWLLRKLPLDYS